MVRLGSVTGLPVVFAGRMLGRVEQSVLTPSGKSLRGMVIRKGMGGAKWLDNEQILVIGGVSVLARGPAAKLPKDADFSLTSVKDASGTYDCPGKLAGTPASLVGGKGHPGSAHAG